MTRRGGRFRTVLTVLSAWSVLAGAALVGAAPASGASGAVVIAPGIEYRQFDIQAAKGVTHAHVLSVDLRSTQVGVGLLYPGKVAARATVSRLAGSAGAVAGVNGDFFNNTETQHPGVAATGAPVGPAIAGGHALKAAVPRGQRFGPALPPGTGTKDVLGVTTDGTARLDSIALDGSVTTTGGDLPLRGLNQYALPVGSVGAFTSDWGEVSRMRAVCGTDTDRAAPCSTDTHEVLVANGHVVGSAGTPGSGAIEAGATVLVGREAGAQQLRKLSPAIRWRYATASSPRPEPRTPSRSAATRSYGAACRSPASTTRPRRYAPPRASPTAATVSCSSPWTAPPPTAPGSPSPKSPPPCGGWDPSTRSASTAAARPPWSPAPRSERRHRTEPSERRRRTGRTERHRRVRHPVIGTFFGRG